MEMISLPEAVALSFPIASSEWKINTVRHLQDIFWIDPLISSSTAKVHVYITNLQKRMFLRAAKYNDVLNVIESISVEHGLDMEYEDIMDEDYEKNGSTDNDDTVIVVAHAEVL